MIMKTKHVNIESFQYLWQNRKKSKINNLGFCPKKLLKEDQIKPKS